ncbi:MAG TPA: hypothetical protein VKH65_05990, partial [Myxococcales bacterium]|nr:hypothetical protein [Myxococcales bacterium]
MSTVSRKAALRAAAAREPNRLRTLPRSPIPGLRRRVEDLYTPEINSPITNGGTVNGVNLSATLAQCDGTTNSLPLSKVGDYTTC